jgi:hypothetical protein
MKYDDYFEDDGDDTKQVKPFPQKWMSASRFKVGQKVVVFDVGHYGNSRPFNGGKNVEAEITELHDGYGSFPPRRVNYGGDMMWSNQHAAWLVVRLPFEVSKSWNSKTGKYDPKYEIAIHLQDEGKDWKLVK